MNTAKREALIAAGFSVGDAQTFLGLNEWEAKTVQFRLRVRKTARRLRESQSLTQQDVAKKIGSSQSRIAKIEAGDEAVAIDLMLRYLFAVGGTIEELDPIENAGNRDNEAAIRSRNRTAVGV